MLEIRPPVRIDKGAGIVSLLRDTDLAAALYVGDDVTDLDAFRGLDELRREGPARLGDQDRRALRRGARRSSREEADWMVEGTDGVRELLRVAARLSARVRFGDFLKATVLLSAGCATLLATLTVLGHHARGRPRGDLRDRRLVGGWRR